MKKVFVLAAALVLFAAPAMAAISGSAHDFSAKGWGSSQLCIFCHTPHGADTSVTDAPLWNHAVTGETFTMYSSTSLQGTVDTAPSGRSKLCLSCHDGVTAIDSFGGATGTNKITVTAKIIGTNLSDDHPISITYAAKSDAGGDPFINDVDANGNATDGTYTLPLYGDKVECASCHEVHNENNNGMLLRVNNSGSKLCLTCHIK